MSAGSVLSWLSGKIFQLDLEGTRRLIKEAGDLPPKKSGLLTLDYFMGSRTPYRDPLLRGAILGVSLGHDRASLDRSAVEGVALASANVVARARELDVPIERIVSAGGYAKNELWLRATVDAIGLPVQMAAEENLTIVGTAAAAATGVGLFPDLRTAAAAVARDGRMIEPDLSLHAHYAEGLQRYRDATECLTPLLHELAGQETRAAGPLPVQQRQSDTLDARAY